MSTARFKVYGRIDKATSATVTIDRTTSIFAVRLHRRRRTYELPLAFVAGIVFERIVKAEAAEKRAAQKERRRQRR